MAQKRAEEEVLRKAEKEAQKHAEEEIRRKTEEEARNKAQNENILISRLITAQVSRSRHEMELDRR